MSQVRAARAIIAVARIVKEEGSAQNMLALTYTLSDVHTDAFYADCARKAILEIFPTFGDRYERIVQPHFDRVLQQRWPDEELSFSDPRELVN